MSWRLKSKLNLGTGVNFIASGHLVGGLRVTVRAEKKPIWWEDEIPSSECSGLGSRAPLSRRGINAFDAGNPLVTYILGTSGQL